MGKRLYGERKAITIRLPLDVYEYITNRAKAKRRSFNNELTMMIEQKCMADVDEAAKWINEEYKYEDPKKQGYIKD